jgi:hypothetical protein
MDIQLIDEPCYLNLKPETSNVFFKLMEESYAALPQSLGLCRVAGAESKGGLNQEPAEGYALDVNVPTSEDSFRKG